MNWLAIVNWVLKFFAGPSLPAPMPDPTPLPQPTPPKYLWDTPANVRHSVRLICDEEGLSVIQKNTMSQVIHCESGYKCNIVHPNRRPSGAVTSTDFGVAQWNDFWHGKEISPDEALHNPEKAIRLMCTYVKEGRINQWVCFSAGLYKNYSA